MNYAHLLKSKKAIVTGGTAGIGRAIALKFAAQGASVIIFGTHAERAQEVLKEMESVKQFQEQKFSVELTNIANKSSVDEAFSRILAEWGSIDILINNAGITKDGLLMKMSEEDWDQVIAVNLKSVYNTCHALARSMIRARIGGKIINISSIVGLTGNAGQVNYAASKAGMIGFTKALAKELAMRNICVNCIAPGFIRTPMTDSLTDAQKENVLKQIPMERFGEPEDIANAALFLACDFSNFMTGQVLVVDGGMVM
jgi:3-oxoacyl-[acyl-carrier protein] reductase